MRNLRKIVKILLVTFLFIFALITYIGINLNKYSIYYAQRMPHSNDSDPVLFMVAKNLRWIHIPDVPELNNQGQTSQGIIVYGSDSKKGWKVEKYLSTFFYGDIFKEMEITIDSNGKRVERFTFSNNGKLKEYQVDGKEVEVKDMNSAREVVYDIIQPYIDYQYIPVINLQWLFNWRYQSQFE